MGAIERVKCETCGASWECRTGCGILHGRLENVLTLFREAVQEDVKNKTMQEKFPRFDFSFEKMNCESCQAVVSVPVLELPDKDSRYVGVCPICQGQVLGQERKDMSGMRKPGKLQCPICKKFKLEIQKVGIWD